MQAENVQIKNPESLDEDRLEALLKSEEKYKTLYENAPLPFQSLNADGTYRDINPAWLRTLGYNRDEVIGVPYSDFLHPDWKPVFEKKFPLFKKRGYVHDVHFKIRHKNGEYLDILFEGCIGYEADGSVRQTYCVFQDITKRKLLEDKLLESENLYRKVVEDQTELIMRYLPDGTRTYVNDQYCRTFNISVETALAVNLFEELGQENIVRLKRKIESLSPSNPVLRDEHHSTSSATGGSWHVWTDRGIFDEDGRLTEIQAVGRDTTDYKQIELELRESENSLREAQILSGVGSWSYDPETGKSEWSEGMFPIWGLDSKKGPPHFSEHHKHIHPEDYPEFEKAVQRAVEKGTPYELELRILHPDGVQRTVISRCKTELDESGKVISIRGTNQDITVLKEARNELEASMALSNSIVNAIPDAIVSVDTERKIVSINNSFQNIFEYSEAEVIGRKTSYIYESEAEFERMGKLRYNMTAEEKAEPYIVHYRRKNGEVFPGETLGVPILNNEGERIGFIGVIRDITGRVAAERALERSNIDLRLAQRIANIGNWRLDPEIGVPVWSEQVYKIYEREPSLGPYPLSEYQKIYSGEHWDRFHSAIESAINKGLPYDIELNLELPSGKVKWTHVICEPELEKGPKGHILRGTIQDITERKITEEKLKDTLNTSPGIIAKANLKTGYYIEANQAVSRILGYSIKEFTSKPFIEFIHPDDIQATRETVSDQLEGKAVQVFENRLLCKDGSYKWISWMANRASADGIVLGVGTDVTSRKSAELELKHKNQELLDSQSKLQKAQNIAQLGFWEWDLKTDKGLWSDQVLQMFGYEPGEIEISFEWLLDHMNPDDRERVSEGIGLAVKTQKSIDLEYRVYKKDGSEIMVHSVGQVTVDNDGKTTGMEGVLQDISERKMVEDERLKLEAQLLRSQKLEAVGTMAGGIAHDLNNILQGLYLYTGILKDQLPQDQKLRENFQKIIESGDRAKELVKQILTFSRNEDMEFKPLKIQYLLKDVLKLIRASTPTTIEVNTDIDTKCGAVLCDSTQIHQVFVNLCNNAVHAMEESGGTLSVSLKEVSAKIEVEPGHKSNNEAGVIELVVADTGHGIDAETINKIYDPFFTTKGVGQGTGLGLSIVHGIVNDIQGEIKVTSKPGKGTTFRILMPITTEAIIEEQVVDTDAPTSGLKILFVDDDKQIANAAKLILESQSHHVTTASTGRQALELFQREMTAFDLIITDLTMPEMTGLELGKSVRKLSNDIQIILTSGNLDLEMKEEYKSLGLNGLVRKPWTAPEMFAVINSLEFD